MNKQPASAAPVRCRCCGATLTSQEQAAYGGSRCENCSVDNGAAPYTSAAPDARRRKIDGESRPIDYSPKITKLFHERDDE
jgi:phage FluMu protein Com